MLGKITINPSQVNSEYICFIKSYNTIKMIYKHPICTITPLLIIVPIVPHHQKEKHPYIPKGLLMQLVQLEYAILNKWKSGKQPSYHMKSAIYQFVNSNLTENYKVGITLNGIWETPTQYGISYVLGNMQSEQIPSRPV